MSEAQDKPVSNELIAASLGATIQYGVATIQGLIAGNAGAIAALVAFKSGATLRLYACPLVIFAVGFALSILCGFFSYLSQSAYTRDIRSPNQCHRCRGDRLRIAAICAGIGAFLALVAGGVWSIVIGLR